MPQHSFTNLIGSPFIELQSVDSTNNYARQQIHAGLAQHGVAIFTHEQVAGKGQRGKIWTSEKDLNIAMSIIIKPILLPLSGQFHLSACAAVAVQDVLLKYAGEDCKIKWPNDLYWQDRKAGGILIESIVSSSETGAGNWSWAIIGIGININQTTFPADLPNPVSLKQITGKNYDPVAIAKEICVSMEKRYCQLVTDGFEELITDYNLHLFKRAEIVKLKKDNRVFEATIKNVSPSGKLIAIHAKEEAFDFGSVEWVI